MKPKEASSKKRKRKSKDPKETRDNADSRQQNKETVNWHRTRLSSEQLRPR